MCRTKTLFLFSVLISRTEPPSATISTRELYFEQMKAARLSSGSAVENSTLSAGGLSITPGSSSRITRRDELSPSLHKRQREVNTEDLDGDSEEDWITTSPSTLPRRQQAATTAGRGSDKLVRRSYGSGGSPSRQLRFSAEFEATPPHQLSQANRSFHQNSARRMSEGEPAGSLQYTVSKEANLRSSRALPSPTSPLWGSDSDDSTSERANSNDMNHVSRPLELLGEGEDSSMDNSFSATQEAEALEGSRSTLLRAAPHRSACYKEELSSYVETTNAFFLMIDRRPVLTALNGEKQQQAARFGRVLSEVKRSMTFSAPIASL